MVLKVNLFKRAISIEEESEIQLGLEIKDNNNTINIYKQICALVAN